MNKSTRISILLAVDLVFFLLELCVGYAVHSLALVADSFHMLNDIISLMIAAWAVQVANQEASAKFTYGWQRAETLGALINGVFLVALCLSIFLEAIQRFVEPQEVSNPVLVLVVGCCGLLSNVLGLFLFHDHGHSHGNSHDATVSAEEGTSAHVSSGLLPAELRAPGGSPEDAGSRPGVENGEVDSTNEVASHDGVRRLSVERHRNKRHSSGSRQRFPAWTDDNIHPASFRKGIIDASKLEDIESADATESEPDMSIDEVPSESSPLMGKRGSLGPHRQASQGSGKKSSHVGHRHTIKSSAAQESHSHSDLNMRGVFLHVMGDALGNLGVIGSALFIWLTPFWWRHYSDPVVSLVITIIILASAIPLCKAASRILLQAVPAGVDVADLKEDIRNIPGIIDCHHVHVWQLSDTKLVASLHIEVGFDFKGEGSARYMNLAQTVRACLHGYGIHSSTIQPEFNLDPAVEAASSRSSAGSSLRGDQSCLLKCGTECANGTQCCVMGNKIDNKHT